MSSDDRQVILVDDDNRVLGTAPRSTVHTTETPLHRAFSCHVRRSDGRWLLSRRAVTKLTWPGGWTNAFCGPPQPDEDPVEAIVRHGRDELGFDGVMVTDDLGMLSASGVEAYRDPAANAVTALVAGNDLVLMVAGSTADTAPQMVEAIVRAVDDGTLSPERLRDAAERVMAVRLALAERG